MRLGPQACWLLHAAAYEQSVPIYSGLAARTGAGSPSYRSRWQQARQCWEQPLLWYLCTGVVSEFTVLESVRPQRLSRCRLAGPAEG
jgi:hypothetical protein